MARRIVACTALALWFLSLPALGQVSVSVLPKATLINPYKKATFSFTWRIEPHPDNRSVILTANCGGDYYRSVRESWAKLTQNFLQLTVLENCEFKACVIRMVEGEEKTLCDSYIAHVPKEE